MWEAISKFHTEKIGGKIIKCFFLFFFLSNQTLGELLDINFRSVYDFNKAAIMTKAALFGLSWLRDGATIKKMPLINMLVMSGDKPPAVISICDCTGHMEEGGKKDAEFIMNFFKSKVDEFDPSKVYTDSFFLTELQMCRKQGRYFVRTFHEQCVSMVASMCCHCFSVIFPGLVQLR